MVPSLSERLLASAPFLFSVAISILSPLVDRIVGKRIESDLSKGQYVPTASAAETPKATGSATETPRVGTPAPVILYFSRWSTDVGVALSAILGPAVGLALGGAPSVTTGTMVFYLVFILVGVCLLVWILAVKDSVEYGKHETIGFTRVALVASILYVVAAVSAFVLAEGTTPALPVPSG